MAQPGGALSNSSGGWKAKTKVSAGLVSGESSLSGLQMAILPLGPDTIFSMHMHS